MDARRVRRGDSGLMATLIIFVVLFVIAGVFAVVFYMQAQEAQADAQQARDTLSDVASSRDRGTDLYGVFRDRAGNSGTVFGAMRAELENLRTRVAGQPTIDLAGIEQRLDDLGVDDATPLVTAINDLNSDRAALESQLDQLRQQMQGLEQQRQLAAEQLQTEQEEYESTMADLTARIDQLRQDYEAYQEQVANQRAELTRRLEQARDEAEQEIRSRDNQISTLENRLTERDTRIQQLIREIGSETPDVPDQTQQPDGRIVSVANERNMVYIDLGRRHHMVLGMRFEVFDRVRGVQTDAEGELRGKATIEVVSISENSSAARIVRASQARPVLADDVIANLIYDRDRQFKFFVYGDFDLDGDGRASVADREMVNTMIREWGGTVVEPEDRQRRLLASFNDEDIADARIVPPDVDFVVVGREPQMPQDLAPGQRDAVRIQEQLSQQEEWERYHRIVDAAASLSIPVLNENRFLALVGHTED